MRNHLPHLLSLIVNTPLMAHPRKAAVVYSTLRQRAGGAGIELPDMDAQRIDALRPEPEANEFIGTNPAAGEGTWLRREPFRLDAGVGIISTVGSMVNRGGWIGNDGSGLVSYEGTKFQLQRAGQDSRVKSIILDVETPGGQAVGAMELAQAVREVAAIKPVYAIANGMACSAGYALISGATQIITTPSGLVGSIGVVMLHLDQSQMLADAGVKPTFIHAGAKKVQGNSLQPLSDEDAADLQAEVDATYDLFLETVGLGRGARLTPAQARATEAGTFMGRAAVDVGLADDVGTFEEVLREAQSRARASNGTGAARNRSSSMSVLGPNDQGGQQAGGPAPTPATFSQAQVDAAVTAARTEASTAATAAANERFGAILGHADVAGRESAALALAIENPSMSADSVVAFVVKHVPAASAAVQTPERKTIADRAKQAGGTAGVNNAPLTGDAARPGGEQSTEAAQAKEGWAAALGGVQSQFKAAHATPGSR